MARPITWQNINSPQGALSIEAFLRSGRQAAEGFENMGNVFQKARDEIQAAATGAAVAQIANSDNPMAVMQAAPKGWQFDPLAIATAANSRNSQLRAEEVQDATLASTKLQQQLSQAQLDDRIAVREAEDIALPYRDAILSGQKVEIDRSDERWRTAAGKLALDRIDSWYKDYSDNKYKQDSLALERARAAREMRNEAEAKAIDDALGALAKRAGTAEGAAWDPAEYDRIVTQEYEKRGISLRHLDLGRGAINLGLSGNKPTDAELDAVNPNLGGTPRDLLRWQEGRIAKTQADTRANISQYDTALRGGQLMANNPYIDANGKQLSDDEAAQKFIEKTRAGEGSAKDWQASDVKERVQTIQNWAAKEGLNITRPQAFLLAESTVGQFTPWDTVKLGPFSIINDSIRADARDFNDLNRLGGLDKVNADIAAQKTEEAKAIATIQREMRLVEASARNPEIAAPKTLIRSFQEDPGRKRDALNSSLTIVRNQEAMLRQELSRGNASVASALQAVSKQVKKLEQQLEAMK